MFRKQRKVKRYHNIYRGSVTSSPFFKLGASAAALAVLIAAGWFLYEPVYQFVMGIGQEKEPVSTAEQPSEPESESDGFLSGLFGGGELAADFIRADAVDRYIVGILPVIRGRGRRLFQKGLPPTELHLDRCTVADGIPILEYSRRGR